MGQPTWYPTCQTAVPQILVCHNFIAVTTGPLVILTHISWRQAVRIGDFLNMGRRDLALEVYLVRKRVGILGCKTECMGQYSSMSHYMWASQSMHV